MAIFKRQTQAFSEYHVLQRFLPEAIAGDKRILLCGERILGAFLRVPQAGDFRGNMHQGASWQATTLTAHDEHLVKSVRPTLEELGLLFVGLDVIGTYVTEINSTSPMGIRELNALYAMTAESICFDVIEPMMG